MSDTTSATRDRWYRRAAATGHWVRDTGLSLFGVTLLSLVAASGWGGSTLGLRHFADIHMGYHGLSAWLVPGTFDGASVGLSIAAWRAAIHGRGAPLVRVGIVAFTSLSSWMNWEQITDPAGRWIAMLLPISGVTLLEALLSEARRAFQRRHGHQQRPRLHPLRFAFDWHGTWGIIRSYVLAVPLPEQVAQHATPTPVARDTQVRYDATAIPQQNDIATPAATVTPIDRPRRSGGGSGGELKIAMRAAWDRHVADGTHRSLSGKALADEVGASEALGRRYMRDWRDELESTVPAEKAE